MFKNVAGQFVYLLAIDTATNTPKSGDAANITAYISKDGGTVTALTDTSATEADATNAKGVYKFDVSQTESNCDTATFTGKSSTSGVAIIPVTFLMRPANMTAMSIDSSGRLDMAKMAGTALTGRDIGASVLLSSGTGTGQISLSSGAVTAGTVSDKTGYSLSASGLASVTTWTVGITGNITGNLSGSVGSVSGAVGSVTGNVGGNVVGSVGSVSGAVGSVTGNVGGNVTGSVGSVATGGITSTSLATDAISAASVSAAAVTKIQSGLSTYAGGDTSGTTTLLSRITATRAGYIDNLSGGAVMLASSYTAPPSASTISTQVASDLATAHGAGSWATATGFSTLDAAGVRSAVGLASANLDTQLDALPTAVENTTAVWAAATRSLTDKAGFTISGTKTTLDSLNDLAYIYVQAACGDALQNYDVAKVADVPTAADNAAGLLDLTAGVETSLTVRQAMRLLAAIAAGKLSGADGTTITIRNFGDTKDRVTAVVDSNGNRNAITVDLT